MVLMVTVSSLPLTAASQNTPSSEDDLICHTSDPKDCYPRVFQPTDEFQIVHDDQEIPNGLHVRLNIWTGKKEAKINVPDEENPALEGLPVDSAVVLVDQEQPDADTPVIPEGAPEYEPIGKIKEPQHGTQSFFEDLKLVKSNVDKKDQAFDDALDNLEEISHDLYYGLKIAEDAEAVKTLLCLMGDQSLSATEGSNPRDHQAAMILSGALQNNPSALKQLTKIWPQIMEAQCPRDSFPLGKTFFSSFVPADTSDASKSKPAALMAKAKVAAINGLIKDDSIREDFMKRGGMERLLEVLIPKEKEWNGAQRKVGQLVLDNFLDADMGAKLGQWPTAAKLEDGKCQGKASQTEEGCWDYHVERIMKANEGDDEHWSKDVHTRLEELRGQDSSTHQHVDL
jgi:nucleotide exchange factor SIL1